ncbi:MAG: NAD-dependent DNA ligase LigA [Solitalea-like symbiont of Tyrophagus putrescentiae]
MDPLQAKELIIKITKELIKHNYNYYCLANPTISDYEFDKLLKQLKELEEKFPNYRLSNSPTMSVASDLTNTFSSAKHMFPMLSLSNTYSSEEVLQFDTKVKSIFKDRKEIEYVCELKFDGVSINLVYENGILTKSITRGDGINGEDVTTNIKTIYTIPDKISINSHTPRIFEVRGEIFIHKKAFQMINNQRKANNQNLFANPRNLAAGSIKLLDINEVKKRSLDMFCYGLYSYETLPLTHYDRLNILKQWGFAISKEIKLCKNINEVLDFIKQYELSKNTLSFEIDGIVIKVNDISMQQELGSTAKSPRWAVAYKYSSESVEAQILDINFQVGRTGIITPVAILEPTLLNGTIVKRASLHNAAELERLDINTNDTLYIEKSGEIIPKIIGINLDKRKPNSRKYNFISNCIACNTPLVLSPSKAFYYCPNIYNCKPQILARIEHFVSKAAMNIEGFSTETIKMLYNKQLLTSIIDIYSLEDKIEQLSNLKGLGTKSIDNLLTAINKSKTRPLSNLIYAIGIPGIGKTMANTLAEYFKDITKLIDASYDDLINIDGIGEILSKEITLFFKQKTIANLINELQKVGLNIKQNSITQKLSSNKLSNKTFVISGIFDKFTRSDMKKLLSDNGAKVTGSISNNTNYLLIGENPGSSKIEKAQNLNLEIINLDKLKKLLNE